MPTTEHSPEGQTSVQALVRRRDALQAELLAMKAGKTNQETITVDDIRRRCLCMVRSMSEDMTRLKGMAEEYRERGEFTLAMIVDSEARRLDLCMVSFGVHFNEFICDPGQDDGLGPGEQRPTDGAGR